MQQVQFINLSPTSLVNLIDDAIRIRLEDLKINLNSQTNSVYYTRLEVCKKLKISPATLHNWVKQKKLPCFGLGGKIFFKSEDIQNAIVQLNK